MKLLGRYMNGNVRTSIFSDGTKERFTMDDEFQPAFAENMDIKICNRCSAGCLQCHEGSTPDGKLGDIMNEKFIETLHPFQECALGGGDILEHPDLIPFLHKLKEKKVIANITLNQVHFEKNLELVKNMIDQKLVYGLGVSLVNPTDEFIKKIQEFPNAVVHVINGIVTSKEMLKLADHELKVLVLGYKTLRRGEEYYKNKVEFIAANQQWMYNNLPSLLNKFAVLSFDNLAIEQLEIEKRWREFSDEPWDEFYAGDDGEFTYYIDMVERKFARSSTASFDKRYDLLNDVDEMFRIIQNEK
mgnify:CR=1 FL=1